MDVMDFDINEEDDLSTALGTESLAAGDMVPEGFDNIPRTRGIPEQLIQRLAIRLWVSLQATMTNMAR